MSKKNLEFKFQAFLNDETYNSYLWRMKRIVLSMFKWVNLPSSMDERFLETNLFFHGKAAFLNDDKFGFINTSCSSNGNLNIYGLPTSLNCYSYEYENNKLTFFDEVAENKKPNDYSVLVMNNWDRIPTSSTIELFAYRLYLCDRTIDVNIQSQKFPTILLTDEKTKLTMINIMNQYTGNYPFIMGNKNILNNDNIKSLNLNAPFVADKINLLKKEIWNEFLQFLGINSVLLDKKERLIADEVNSNNEVTNYNLLSFLIPRQEACEKFNKLFSLPEDKKISVKINSDLYNVIKQEQSFIVGDNNE